MITANQNGFTRRNYNNFHIKYRNFNKLVDTNMMRQTVLNRNMLKMLVN